VTAAVRVHTPIKGQSAADKIRELARVHGVSYVPGPRDAWAQKVTELSGDDVLLDEVENLILALERAKVLTGAEATQLHIAYYHEK
jgi:hypothetical protein